MLVSNVVLHQRIRLLNTEVLYNNYCQLPILNKTDIYYSIFSYARLRHRRTPRSNTHSLLSNLDPKLPPKARPYPEQPACVLQTAQVFT